MVKLGSFDVGENGDEQMSLCSSLMLGTRSAECRSTSPSTWNRSSMSRSVFRDTGQVACLTSARRRWKFLCKVVVVKIRSMKREFVTSEVHIACLSARWWLHRDILSKAEF